MELECVGSWKEQDSFGQPLRMLLGDDVELWDFVCAAGSSCLQGTLGVGSAVCSSGELMPMRLLKMTLGKAVGAG